MKWNLREETPCPALRPVTIYCSNRHARRNPKPTPADYTKTFQQNNFGNREIGLALRRAFSDKPPAEEQEETKGMAYIPFYGPISGKIGRMLRKQGIKTIHKPPTKIQNLLRPVKGDLGLRTPGVY
ncbi:hypothetical protein ANN_08666 [Periplaneta americana]|uniref:Uncharacterized protein n=1 Tax=Periplaneta americana TaxID=6978 RepID=A0ABQ8T3P9_PERAM|nr:hypothetical protein ANN_08666 [Periplaneta americana]